MNEKQKKGKVVSVESNVPNIQTEHLPLNIGDEVFDKFK
jgi:hypothetical protein